MAAKRNQRKPKKKTNKQRKKPSRPIQKRNQTTRKKNKKTGNKAITTKEINQLTVAQLKQFFTANHIRYKEYCCKQDYLDFAIQLWNKKQKKITGRQHVIGICPECKCVQRMCLLLDCFHTLNCMECAEDYDNCPLCTEPIIDVIGIFVP